MRIAIMGSGGMGGFLGAKLAAAGFDVIFIARGAHKDAINTQGLRLLSKEGDLHINPAYAVDDTTGLETVDLILFCVKLYDTETAARLCLPLMNDNTFILSLQNGVESVDLISKIVGKGKTLGGSIYVSANIEAPGVIRHSGGTNTIRFAEVDNRPSHRTATLERIFNQAGLIGICEKNMQEMLWHKFILLSSNAGIGSLTNSGAVSMCSHPDTREILVGAMWEAYNVADAMGIKLPKDSVDNVLNLILSVGQKQDLIASQCLDLRQGRPLELEWIQGTLHRLGKKYNVPTPITSTAYAALKRFAKGDKI